MLHYLVLVGVLVSLGGNFVYIKDTLKGNTQPNRVSWLLWALVPMIAVGAGFSDGVRWALVPVFMSGFGPFIIFLASFANSKAYWKLERFDYMCGLFSIFAVLFWIFTKDPHFAIAFAILADTFAAIPTLKKMWTQPETETITAYFTALFSALTAFFAIQVWNFSAYAFNVYLTTMTLTFILIFYRKRLFGQLKRL